MTDKKTPRPEEVQQEFEDFVRKRFQGSVQVFSPQFEEEKMDNTEDSEESSSTSHFDFEYTPKEIKAHLDKFVIKQDEAKKALAIAVCDHYNHARLASENESYDYAKQNVLLLGPTGVGKTYLVKKVAELIGVPFVKADATRFSETGYVGANVDDLVRDLVAQADGDIDKAKFGIVYLDEADKIANRGSGGNRDVNSRGVQFGLLRLMEECDVDLKAGNDIQSQMQALMEMQSGTKKPSKVNTKHILFIVSGAFGGLTDIINKRMNSSPIGFNKTSDKRMEEESLLPYAETSDFIEFGFEAEFIGRLPVRVSCEPLVADDLSDILKNSKGSILQQYKASFAAYGIDMAIGEDAIHAIAEKAAVEKTGARALMTVCEKIMRHYKFELPSAGIDHFTLTEKMVQNPIQELELLLTSASEAIPKVLQQILDSYEEEFSRTHKVELILENRLKAKLAEKCQNNPESFAGLEFTGRSFYFI